MLFNPKYTNAVTIFIIVVVCIVYSLYIYTSNKYEKIYLSYQFDGRVESVSYDIKGIAIINVNGRQYDLSNPNWDFDHNRIQKGDSIVKNGNSMTIKLIKPNGKIIVEDGEKSN